MCGICGAIKRENSVNQTQFEKMVDIVEHRGPSGRGVYYDRNIALGHRRLAIIDLSDDGNQPFFYKDRYVCVFNGEIYNYLEIREELVKKGYSFRTQTDTEVLIAAYDYYGQDCVKHFNGMWSFCIFDKIKEEMFCSRDRFGVKPFYYLIDENTFLFGSEIKQILTMTDERPKANKQKLLEFLVNGDLDYSTETMFDKIMKLAGGNNLIFNCKTFDVKIYQWYDLRRIKVKKNSYENASKVFHDKFMRAIQLRLRADVPVGSCLSGGLDSSSIVCAVDRLLKTENQKTSQHTVSSCFEDKRYDEQEFIDEVVDKTNVISHKVFPDMNQLFSKLDSIIWHMDEPFGSTSIFAQWNVFETAKKNGLTVMLDGQGADEQLAGYDRYFRMLFTYYLRRFRFQEVKHEVEKYIELHSGQNLISAKKLILISIVDAYVPEWLKRLARVRHKLKSESDTPFHPDIIIQMSNHGKRYNSKNCQKYIFDNMYYSMAALLHYEDRNSMAHSIESRVPFLDVDLVEAIYSTQFEYKIKDGQTKSILREGLKDILPKIIRERQSKLGFVTPEDQWINDNFNEIRDELRKSSEILSKLIDKERVMKWFDSNKGSMKKGDFTAWRIICAGRWVRTFDVDI